MGARLRFGYAGNNVSLKSRNRTCRYNTFKAEGYPKIKELTLDNLQTVVRILEWNIQQGIFFFRIGSEMVPFGSHPEMRWPWFEDDEVVAVAQRIRRLNHDYRLRLSMHPGQYTVLSSRSEGVIENSIAELEYHARLLELVDGTDMILHVGGAYGDKPSAMNRFEANVHRLSERAKSRLRVENDDRVYNLREALQVAIACQVPVCFDFHHDRCCPSDVPASQLIQAVLSTWRGEVPKVHLSTGKLGETDRSHHDYVSESDFERLMALVDGAEVDVMFEAKAKDLAVLRLLHLQTGVR